MHNCEFVFYAKLQTAPLYILAVYTVLYMLNWNQSSLLFSIGGALKLPTHSLNITGY